MSLVVPESFHYGHFDFPWFGLIEPKLYRRRKWLLTYPETYGPVPVITVGTSGDVDVSVPQSRPSIVATSDNFTPVFVFTKGVSVYYDLCEALSQLTQVTISQSVIDVEVEIPTTPLSVESREVQVSVPFLCNARVPQVSIGRNTVQASTNSVAISIGVGQTRRPASNVSFVVSPPPSE